MHTLFQEIHDASPADSAVVRVLACGEATKSRSLSQAAETTAGDGKRQFGPTFAATQQMAAEGGGNTILGDFYKTARAQGDQPVSAHCASLHVLWYIFACSTTPPTTLIPCVCTHTHTHTHTRSTLCLLRVDKWRTTHRRAAGVVAGSAVPAAASTRVPYGTMPVHGLVFSGPGHPVLPSWCCCPGPAYGLRAGPCAGEGVVTPERMSAVLAGA